MVIITLRRISAAVQSENPMETTLPTTSGKPIAVSPLMLADRLLTLAQDADRAGYTGAAAHLVTAMYKVLDSRKVPGNRKPARH